MSFDDLLKCRMMKEGPEGQLTSAAEYQSSTTEHLSLSQSQQSQGMRAY